MSENKDIEKTNQKSKTPQKNNQSKSSESYYVNTRRLSVKEKAFCRYYVELNNGQQAATKAGYAEKTARITASKLLTRTNVHQEIERLRAKQEASSIATSQQVMQFFTDVMNGKIKDQFGLDASLSDRTRAAQELAKRTVDLDNRIAGKPDTVMEIKLDWSR